MRQYYPMSIASALLIAGALYFMNREVREMEKEMERIRKLYCDVLEEICRDESVKRKRRFRGEPER